MERKAFSVSLVGNPQIIMQVIPGHFTTSNSHINHYLDVSSLKSSAAAARRAARELAVPYLAGARVDTIVCLERTDVIGAYLAEELKGAAGNADIHVVTPISNNIGNLSFLSSMVGHIVNKNILLLTTSISSGRTLNGALDCLAYYRGNIVGISSLFMVSAVRQELPVHSLFTSDDIPGYRLFSSRDCELCHAGQPLDALISSEGFTKI